MQSNKSVNPNARDQCWLERMKKEENHKLKSVYKGINMKIVSSLPVSDKFASSIGRMNPKSSNFIPLAVTTEYFKKNRFKSKDVFGKGTKILDIKAPVTTEIRGKKMYYGDERLSYMDKNIDLSQPEYKRYNLQKPNNAPMPFSKRSYSIDSYKKGTFVDLKHPYQWEIKPKQKINYSFIQEPKETSGKVNNSSFKKSVYKENWKKQNPLHHGKEIATRLNYIEKGGLNDSNCMTTKYLKNFSTIEEVSPLKSAYRKNLGFNATNSVNNFYKTPKKREEVSVKVGHYVTEAFKKYQNYSPLKDKYTSNLNYISTRKEK
ncbi:unnamed protein product [Moneuplotes crassus]|uniref:Uncharacterized protein n=1 Tax=Euplotes crassus TaxID=5936 RepID=A0AAD1XLU2_EUPCR|nr:unnamed protein product [Moneuplotes crassus]